FTNVRSMLLHLVHLCQMALELCLWGSYKNLFQPGCGTAAIITMTTRQCDVTTGYGWRLWGARAADHMEKEAEERNVGAVAQDCLSHSVPIVASSPARSSKPRRQQEEHDTTDSSWQAEPAYIYT
ncbi:hypothetical protein P4O66_009715, partial [Electrophorus voltai]